MKKEYIADLADKLMDNSYNNFNTAVEEIDDVNYNEITYTYAIDDTSLYIIIHIDAIIDGIRELIQDKYTLDKALQIEYLSIRNNEECINKFIKKIPMVYLS